VIAGADGTPGGWIVAVVESRSRVRWHRVADAAEVLDVTADCAAVGVDMALRLPEAGYRRCDVEARVHLGPARSSMFHAPIRAVLAATDYPHACAISREVNGKAISKQTWHIVAKMREWQRPLPERVVEVHPETTFRVLDRRITDGKRSTRGIAQRLIALRAFVDVPEVLADLPPGPSMDDVLDALAAAWSATRWQAGESLSLGDPPLLIEV
jgi:predicted RNase H-like nuclease